MTTNRIKEPHSQSSASLLDTLEYLTGPIGYGPTNDYMFRAVLQENEKALQGLLGALLGIPKEDILSIQILNPIILGEAINEKTIVLDLKILLNNNQLLNLEMQVLNQGDWPERSLFYLCRNFAKLKRGGTYKDLSPLMHISILDFSPFPNNQQFYSEYMLLDVKTHQKYSDKLVIRMLNLKQLENVNEGDCSPELYRWGKLFKATTWEELKMLAKKDSSISEFTFTLHEMSEDEKIQEQCLAREMYEMDQASIRAYGLEQGLQQGIQQGLQQGSSEKQKQLTELYKKLLQSNRAEDFLYAFSDEAYMEQLLKEFNL